MSVEDETVCGRSASPDLPGLVCGGLCERVLVSVAAWASHRAVAARFGVSALSVSRGSGPDAAARSVRSRAVRLPARRQSCAARWPCAVQADRT